MTGNKSQRVAIRRLALLGLSLASGCAAAAISSSAMAEPQPSSTIVQTTREAAATALQGAQDLAMYALSLIGVSYKFGGSTPEAGLDCSGLVRYVFQEVTGVLLPRTSKELARLGDQVALRDLKPGDLVFFNTRRLSFSHVGIFLGDGRFIHAPSRGREVEIVMMNGPYWAQRFDGARRLVGVLPSLSFLPTASAQDLAPLLPILPPAAAPDSSSQIHPPGEGFAP